MIVRVDYTFEAGRLNFEFICEELEPKESSSSLAKKTFFVDLGSDFQYNKIHPDHLALSAFLAVRPWIQNKLTLSKPISPIFAKSLATFGINAGPIDTNITPYSSENGKYIGLAFSGGADSTAALSVLPKTAIPVFLDRPNLKTSIYSKEAALASCQTLRGLGYDCHIVKCDLESIRNPIGFPTDLSNAIPAIVMATALELFGIAYGTVLESVYGLGRIKFKDYKETSHKKMWWDVFKAAGLPISFPVGGVSEVGTEIICSLSKIGSISQSCIRGKVGLPCYFCWKCFRKSVVRESLNQSQSIKTHLLQLLESKEVRTKLGALPISHENVFLYAFGRIGFSEFPDGFESRFVYSKDLSYLEKWYPPSLELIHPRIKNEVANKISSFLNIMNDEDEVNVSTWDMSDRVTNLAPLSYE